MKQLLRAGHSVRQHRIFEDKKIGTIIDIELEHPLDQDLFDELYTYVIKKHNYMIIQIKHDYPILRLIPIKEDSNTTKSRIIKTALLMATFITVYMTGYGLFSSYTQILGVKANIVLWSFIYTISFLGALSIHELGHMFSSKKNGVLIDGPYFIPAPPIQLGFIGTLGAIIKMKTLPSNRRNLALLGVSGPLSGFIIGLIIGIIGIHLSPTIPIKHAEELIRTGEVSELSFMPLIIALLTYLKPMPENYILVLHPLAFSSLIIMFVTFLNLLPIGQLDGGHVIRSIMSSSSYEKLNYLVISFFAIMGLLFFNKAIGQYFITISIVLTILKFLTGRKPHPGPANQYANDKSYAYLALYFLLLVLTMPIPL